MKCEEVENRMLDYLENSLDEKERAEVENHLATCERCIDCYNESQQILRKFSEVKMEEPESNLKINFYHMLQSEIKKNESPEIKPVQRLKWYKTGIYRMAAAIALFIAGTFTGIFYNSGINNRNTAVELRQLHSEISDLKKSTIFTLLENGTSSDRIQAVSYAEEIETADPKIISVLVKTLNEDKNVNVRMAAAWALSKYNNQSVNDSLVASLAKQTEPMLQITLINIIAEKKEKSAFETIQKIISDRNTLKEVRDVAGNSLHLLI